VPYELTENGFVPIPEPSTFLLMGFGVIGVVGLKRKFSI